jgi:LacI family transcriptional regulator
LPSSDDPAHLQKILDTGLPIVLISTLIENKNITSVLTNNFDGAKTAVNYLIKKGHKKIAFIGGGGNKYTDTERLNGYKTALKNNNRKVDETYIINNRGYTRENGYKSMKELFKNKTAPDAIFAHNDLIALGAIQAIKEEKLLIPQDISIIGFDDIFFASLPEIQLSTIAQQKYRMGQVASEALIEQISSKSNKLTSEKIMIDYSFKIRNTCR